MSDFIFSLRHRWPIQGNANTVNLKYYKMVMADLMEKLTHSAHELPESLAPKPNREKDTAWHKLRDKCQRLLQQYGQWGSSRLAVRKMSSQKMEIVEGHFLPLLQEIVTDNKYDDRIFRSGGMPCRTLKKSSNVSAVEKKRPRRPSTSGSEGSHLDSKRPCSPTPSCGVGSFEEEPSALVAGLSARCCEEAGEDQAATLELREAMRKQQDRIQLLQMQNKMLLAQTEHDKRVQRELMANGKAGRAQVKREQQLFYI